jgi:hypothetical protein
MSIARTGRSVMLRLPSDYSPEHLGIVTVTRAKS